MDLSNRQGRREQGQRIQSAVEAAGLSIEELAAQIGCSRALIYQYLSGSTLAQPDRLQLIASVCGVPLTYFYSDTTDADAEVSRDGSTDGRSGKAEDVLSRLQASLTTLGDLANAQESPADYRAAASTLEQMSILATQIGDQAGGSRILLRLGNACLRLADYGRAIDVLRRAIELAEKAGSESEAIEARQSLGNVLVSTGNLKEAEQQFAVVSQYHKAEVRWKGCLSLGSVSTMRGEYREAMQRFEDAATCVEEAVVSGDLSQRDAAIAMLYVDGNRANVYINGGDLLEARPLVARCLATAESNGVPDEQLEARFDLAWCDYHAGRWHDAYHGLNSVIMLARFVGDQSREALGRAWMAIILSSFGEFNKAVEYGKEALSSALTRGDRRAELYAQLGLADAYSGSTQRVGEALYHANQALAVARSMQLRRGEAECLLRMARLEHAQDNLAAAVASATAAREIASKLGCRHIEALAMCELSALNVDAEASARIALQLSESTGLCEGIWRSHSQIARLISSIDHLRGACSLLDQLRSEVVRTGMPDALLENGRCYAVYLQLGRMLQETGDQEAMDAFLESSAWPPLELELASAQ